jgi:hypothetical protein
MKAPAENLPMLLTVREVGRLCGRAPQHIARLVRRTVGFDFQSSADGSLLRLDKLPALRVIAAMSMKPKIARTIL